MRFCRSCGQQIREGTRFCPACGIEFEQRSTHEPQDAVSYAATRAVPTVAPHGVAAAEPSGTTRYFAELAVAAVLGVLAVTATAWSLWWVLTPEGPSSALRAADETQGGSESLFAAALSAMPLAGDWEAETQIAPEVVDRPSVETDSLYVPDYVVVTQASLGKDGWGRMTFRRLVPDNRALGEQCRELLWDFGPACAAYEGTAASESAIVPGASIRDTGGSKGMMTSDSLLGVVTPVNTPIEAARIVQIQVDTEGFVVDVLAIP